MQKIFILFLASLLFSGCAIGFMTSYSHDAETGKSTKTVYSPLFSSDSLPLAEGAEFRVSVVNTRRVEPISYSLLASIGGLPPEDLESKATAVVHFKNDSQETYRIILKKIRMHHQEFSIRVPEIILKPGNRYDIKSVPVKIGTKFRGQNSGDKNSGDT